METVLLHKSAFLYVTSIFRLSSFVFANALLTGITKTFVPFYSSFPEIFSNLFIDYYPSLISFALYYVGDKTIAEDLVQEVFVKLWETRERWSAVGDFSAYVYQMVRFKCFNYLRAEKIRNEATRSFTEEVDITEINNYIAEETFRLVMNSMEDLPPACRTVFSLTLEGYSAKEIAEKLDIAVETVKKQKQIARKILKEKFGKLFLFLPAVLFS